MDRGVDIKAYMHAHAGSHCEPFTHHTNTHELIGMISALSSLEEEEDDPPAINESMVWLCVLRNKLRE